MEKNDIKYMGIPNICFSLTDDNDEREVEFKQQRLSRGFDDSETWSLRDTIAKFIIPRLERYLEVSENYVNNTKETEEITQFLTAMKLIARNNGIAIYDDAEEKQIKQGLKKFTKIFMGLWW